MTGLTDITHFELFRVLDYLKADCEKKNQNESWPAIKYADIFNFAASCREVRRMVRFWSKTMYNDMEIDALQDVYHSHVTVKFEEMHKSLKGATAKKVDNYLDIFIRALLKNPQLKTLELRHTSQSFFSYHQYMFDEIVLAICGQSKLVKLDTDRLPKFKEITVNIADQSMENLSALANTRISKLKLTASFAISDLKKFCAGNPALVTLEINAFRFSDHRQLSEIVGHCPSLKQLKFVMSDNAWDREYVKLALLEKLQHLEIAKQPVQINFGWDEDHIMTDIASKQAEYNSVFHDDDSTLENNTPNEDHIMEDIASQQAGSNSDHDDDSTLENNTPNEDHIMEDIASKQAGTKSVHDDDSTLENNTPLLLLIKALSERKKSRLVQLRLMFEVTDDVVQAIAQLKGLRMLECGFCDTKSIEHLKRHPTLNRLSIRNRDHIITDDIADLLRKHVTVSNSFTKMSLNQRGDLFIDTNEAELFRFVSLDPLLRLENLKSLWLSENLFKERQRDLPLFLELDVKIRGTCDIVLDPKLRFLKMLYDMDYTGEEIALPLVRDLRSFKLVFKEKPTFHFLERLIKRHRNTLENISIETIFEHEEEDDYLTESLVKALTFLTRLRKVACEVQELRFIQQLAQLKDLEEIYVKSKHDPRDILLNLVPLLERCRKLSSFKIQVPVSGINQAFVEGLRNAVLENRDSDMQDALDICLMITKPITPEQLTLFDDPSKLMILRYESMN